MGYYTKYELEVKEETRTDIDHEKEICDIVDYKYLFEDATKWYDHEKDMRDYSKKYPRTLFILSGIGEESPDLWRRYFKNGKMQDTKAIITYVKYEESKLSWVVANE